MKQNIGSYKINQPTAIVIFGASGDLTHRKLIPALFDLYSSGFLPSEFFIVGASRSKFSDIEFRETLISSIHEHSRYKESSEPINDFLKHIFYHSMDGTIAADYKKLKENLAVLSEKFGAKDQFNFLYYLSTAPEHFGIIASNLDSAGLVEKIPYRSKRSSLIIEKPFGTDLDSAKELNDKLQQHWREDQIFRIDHYLGKETIQNILVFRFGNGIFEPLWNGRYVDHIQISVCEDLGIGNRGGYFDHTGILKDVVQNHILQMLSLLCIEPPTRLNDPEATRNEKVKVLSAIRRMSPQEVWQNTIRGQYTAGTINNENVIGYLEEKHVSPQSTAETYVAMKLEIDNWRWSGVPIYVRVGKRMQKSFTEISVYFRQAPLALFQGYSDMHIEQNVLSIQVQPKESIVLKINSKSPGMGTSARPVDLQFSYSDSFNTESPAAYERLLLDAMRGDTTLFIRDDEIEQSWIFWHQS